MMHTNDARRGAAPLLEAAVCDFLRELNGSEIFLHSLLLIQHGTTLAEAYAPPFAAHTPQRMFSISKSIVSVCIGCCAEMGLLDLDDRIVAFFPDKQPGGTAYPEMQALTIRQMLMMQTPHSANAYKVLGGKDWVRDFFSLPPDHEAGSLFFYDTACVHTLGALVEKLSGLPLERFFRERVLRPLSLENEPFAFLRDPCGICQGGSGLVTTPRCVAGVFQLLLGQGAANGRRILPAAYIRQATSRLVDLRHLRFENIPVFLNGYGYLFWTTRLGGFSAFGMGGQVALCLPREQAVFIATADLQGATGYPQMLYDAFERHLYPALRAQPAAGAGQPVLRPALALEAVRPSQAPAGRFCRRWALDTGSLPFLQVGLEVSEAGGRLLLQLPGRELALDFGYGKNLRTVFPGTACPCVASGGWQGGDSFLILCQLFGEVTGNIRIRLCCKGSRLNLCMQKFEETHFAEFQGFAGGRQLLEEGIV